MTTGVNNTLKVSKGDCPWTAAKKSLVTKGAKPTNGEIVKEMKRLAELNGCNSVDDFSKKFFTRVGLEFVIDNNASAKKETPAPAPVQIPNDSAKVAANAPVVKPAPVETPADSTKVGSKAPGTKPVVQKTAKEQEVEKINNLSNDTARIIEYNKTNYEHQYYGIVDKKTCKLNIYDKNGNVVKSFPVGVGKTKGDKLQAYYAAQDDKGKALKEQYRYTTPGEFTLDEYASYGNKNYISNKDNKHKVMALKGDNRGVSSGQTCIHMIPNNRSERVSALDSETTADNRVSYGCVNLREDDYDEMAKYLGEGNKIYILPEEKGNKLQLEKQTDGSYKFEQQYHKDDVRGVSKDVASKVNYDVKPNNNPVFIAQQKNKAKQERLLAEQKTEQQRKRDEVVWYNPFTWSGLFTA
ncbi:L,D-transpeptidase family protein [bacterium]|nr:L,D-transpeptidase family protein [bacterium]